MRIPIMSNLDNASALAYYICVDLRLVAHICTTKQWLHGSHGKGENYG